MLVSLYLKSTSARVSSSTWLKLLNQNKAQGRQAESTDVSALGTNISTISTNIHKKTGRKCIKSSYFNEMSVVNINVQK
jgi:hypothetical protein